jgi:thioredoxin-like negative regulator of GroEL
VAQAFEERGRAIESLDHALALNRGDDAAEALRRATDLAPTEPLVLVEYRRALLKLGRTHEAALILSRLNQTRTSAAMPPRPSGFTEYLRLSPADQRARYLADLRKSAGANPGDLQIKTRLAAELLHQGKTAQGLDVFRELKASTSDPAFLARCGRILIDFEQYGLARQFLELAVAADATWSAARLDLATVLAHLQNPAFALAELDRIPEKERNGDYYLLRAQLLDGLGRVREASDALSQGIRRAPTRADLYLQGAGFLIKHKLYDKALTLLEQASGLFADDRDLLFAQAATLAMMPREEDALKLLARFRRAGPSGTDRIC